MKEANNETITKYADRVKVDIERWASGKVRWSISVAGETQDDVLGQIFEIEEKLWARYYGKE